MARLRSKVVMLVRGEVDVGIALLATAKVQFSMVKSPSKHFAVSAAYHCVAADHH